MRLDLDTRPDVTSVRFSSDDRLKLFVDERLHGLSADVAL